MAQVIKVTDIGNDVIEVHGIDDHSGEEVVAYGWASAMENYFQPACYDIDGNLHPDAAAREMTQPEREAYWKELLGEPFVPDVLYDAEG